MERPDEQAGGDEPREDKGAAGEAAPTPEEFEEDPARNPDSDELKDIKGG